MKTFKDMTTSTPNALLVVDSLNLAFRWKHNGAKVFAEDFIGTVESLKKSYKTSKVIITCDAGSSSFRKKIFPEYKANRKERFAEQTDAERLAFEAFFEEFNRTIDIYKEVGDYPTLRYSGVEADDIAAYIVRRYKKSHQIWLMSSDKDWDLLVDENVSRFSYVTRKEITKENWHEHYGYDMDKHISIKCLMGDSGDNIPGVDGVGPKRAQSLVEEYGDTYDIIASLPITSKYKYIDSLNKFGSENLLRNYMLMDLVSYCEEAIGKENCEDIDRILGEYLK
jgi:5'-3' exonuclease